METNPLHFSVCSHPKNLTHVRGIIADITSKTSLSLQEQGNIILAVDEACSNIIRHSYQNDYTRKIDLTVLLRDGILTISIIDDGIHVDMNSIQPRNINDIQPGKLGLYIIREVMDSVEYDISPEGWNRIKMIKHLV